MGTKNNPAAFDCYGNAEPDEPMFILLARDVTAPEIVEQWAIRRMNLISEGHKPDSDRAMVDEAGILAQLDESNSCSDPGDHLWLTNMNDGETRCVHRKMPAMPVYATREIE